MLNEGEPKSYLTHPPMLMRRKILRLYKSKILLHVGVAVVSGGHEGLLDDTRDDPADEVELTTGLVVGTAGTSTAEGLHTHNGAGRLVVDVEVAGSIAELVGELLDLEAVAAPNGAGQAIR